MATVNVDQDYLKILLRAIEKCSSYQPKLGHGKEGCSMEKFQEIYGSDPFYSWLGLDDPLMYAAHKAAGGMTSIYRQIGIGCEEVFQKILQNTLQIKKSDSQWAYEIERLGGKKRKLSLDGRIPLDKIQNKIRKDKIQNWMKEQARILKIKKPVLKSLSGVVFEIRQGYKSKDSKRQNADIANAATAYINGYLPCVGMLSQQIDEDIAMRYQNEKWVILTGTLNDTSSQQSFYTFMREIIGYDLAAFFEENKKILRSKIKKTLNVLLSPQ